MLVIISSAIIFGLLGAFWLGEPGLLGGVLLGGLGGWLLKLQQRVEYLQQRVNALQALTTDKSDAPIPEASQATMPLQIPTFAITEASSAKPELTPTNLSSTVDVNEDRTNDATDYANSKQNQDNGLLGKALQVGRDCLFGGNIFVRLGILLVFLGVVFLLRYSLEHNLLPIELRLAGAASGAIALLVIGWYLRRRVGAYGLILQAGGVGLLYLTVFAAYSLYQLIPAGLAFGIMLILVVLSVALALLQNSRALAIFAMVGGFLAPLLSAGDSANYIALFSFYALLNAGIVLIAWFKTWRLLNLIGFVFTFVIATFWGWSSYEPADYAYVQFFLILFFLFYVIVAVLFATRSPLNFKDKVDSSLVFGVPLIGFGLQIALVRDVDYGVAISALLVGAFYLVSSLFIWKRWGRLQQLLVETFLVLGVIFTTLAIPFALDGNLTMAIWAIEGAGIVWISIRQQQFLRRLFGVLLQYAALVYGFYSIGDLSSATLWASLETSSFFNTQFIGLLLIAVAMAYSSYRLTQPFEGKHLVEVQLANVLFFTALTLQCLAFALEIVVHRLNDWALLYIGYALVSAMVLIALSRVAQQWPLVRFALVLPVLALVMSFLAQWAHYFLGASMPWPWWFLGFAAVYALLYIYEKQGLFTVWLQPLQLSVAWLVLLVTTFEFVVGMQLRFFLNNDSAWLMAAWAVPSLVMLGLILNRSLQARLWPLKQYAQAFIYQLAVPLVMLLAFWAFMSGFSQGNSAPLPWLPIFNPLDLALLLFGLLVLKFYRELTVPNPPLALLLFYGSAGLAFGWLNVLTLRVLHYYGGFPWQQDLIVQATTQTSLAILWTLTGLVLTWFGYQRSQRAVWLTGAALLSVVVLKLFLVDFAASGTLARVVSFISVGVLLLFIGYVAPLPPAKIEEKASKAANHQE